MTIKKILFLVKTKHLRRPRKRRKLQHHPTTGLTHQTHHMLTVRPITEIQHIHTPVTQHTTTINRVITNKVLMDMEINGEVMDHPTNCMNRKIRHNNKIFNLEFFPNTLCSFHFIIALKN